MVVIVAQIVPSNSLFVVHLLGNALPAYWGMIVQFPGTVPADIFVMNGIANAVLSAGREIIVLVLQIVPAGFIIVLLEHAMHRTR